MASTWWIYLFIFNIRPVQYYGAWYITSFYNHAERHWKILHVLASHPSDSRDNSSATEGAQHKPVSSRSIFFGNSQMGCRAASCQRHPSEGIPPRQEKGSEPALPQWGWDVAGGRQVYGSHPSALCNYLHSLSSPLESFEVCSYDIFMSAKKLQGQLKVTDYWEWGSLLVFLCETSIKPGVSVCTHPSGTELPSSSINWQDQNIFSDSRNRNYSSFVL